MVKKRKLSLFIGLLIAVGIAAIVIQNSKAVDIRVATVKRGLTQEYIELRGKVELNKKEKVYSKVAGIVESIQTEEGDQVNAGQKLAQLDTQDLTLHKEKAEASYEAAKASFEDLIHSIKPEQIRQSELQLEQAKIALESAQKDYDYKRERFDRIKKLFKGEAVSQQDVDDAEILMNTAASVLSNAKQRLTIARYDLDVLHNGASKHAIKASKANVKQAELQVEELKNDIQKTILFSGIKGTVLTKYIEKGAAVQAGSPLYEIGDYDSAYIRVDVLVDDTGKISIGQKAVISGEVLGDKKLQGTIYYIAPKAESSISSLGVEQQKLEVRITFDNTAVRLKPKLGVDVDIIIKEKQSALYIPKRTIFDKDGIDHVFVVTKGRLELRAIKKGMENDSYVEVMQHLSEGEKVVVDPDYSLKPGMRVRDEIL